MSVCAQGDSTPEVAVRASEPPTSGSTLLASGQQAEVPGGCHSYSGSVLDPLDLCLFMVPPAGTLK